MATRIIGTPTWALEIDLEFGWGCRVLNLNYRRVLRGFDWGALALETASA